MSLDVLVLVGSLLLPSAGMAAEECVVYGKVYRADTNINMELKSTCVIRVERNRSALVLKSVYRSVEIRVPKNTGVYPFMYQWGQNTAQFGEEEVEISFGPAGES